MSAEPTSQSTPTSGNTSFSSSTISQRLKQTFASGVAPMATPSSMPADTPAAQPTDSIPSDPSMTAATMAPVIAPDALSPVVQEELPTTEPQIAEVVPSQLGQPIETAPQEILVEDQQLETQLAETPTPELQAQEPAQPQPPADTLNVPYPTAGFSKEAPAIQVTVENPVVDSAGGVQYVETAELEKPPEMPPEVEGFLQTVENNIDQIPQEVVISNPQTGQALPRVLAQPVVILPITPELEKQGKWKPPTHSLRWLIEWSWKMMKVFSGKVIYRKAEVAS